MSLFTIILERKKNLEVPNEEIFYFHLIYQFGLFYDFPKVSNQSEYKHSKQSFFAILSNQIYGTKEYGPYLQGVVESLFKIYLEDNVTLCKLSFLLIQPISRIKEFL